METVKDPRTCGNRPGAWPDWLESNVTDPTPAPCKVADDHCSKSSVRMRGYCETHYRREVKYGSPHIFTMDMRPMSIRWRDHIAIDDQSGCWNWTGCLSRGYGVTSDRSIQVMVHIWIWEHLREPVPDGLELDHLCRNRACCNPDHLEPVTHLENVQRGEAGKWQRDKTHCKNGHEFTPENTISKNGGKHRACRECSRTAIREYMRKKRAAAKAAS